MKILFLLAFQFLVFQIESISLAINRKVQQQLPFTTFLELEESLEDSSVTEDEDELDDMIVMTYDDVTSDMEAPDDSIDTDEFSGDYDLDKGTVDEVSVSELEEELDDLLSIFENMEDFEIVVIDGDEYNKDELEAEMEEIEEQIEQESIADAALDIEIMMSLSNDPGNLMDFEGAMETAEILLDIMDDDDIVYISDVEYTKDSLYQKVLDAKVAVSGVMLDLEVQDLEELELIETSEDSLETYIKETIDIMQRLQDGQNVVINEEELDLDDLEDIVEECFQSLEDLDEGKDIDDQISDIEDQFLIENLLPDDYNDENEEIQEVLDISQELITINGEIYNYEELLDIIEYNSGIVQDFAVEEQTQVVMDLFYYNLALGRLDYEDFLKGMAEVDVLISLMDDTDVAHLDQDDFTKEELVQLSNDAVNYSEMQNQVAAIDRLEANVLSEDPTSEELQDEIALLEDVISYIEGGEVVTIDGEICGIEELNEILEELNQLLSVVLNEDSLENELGDVQYLLEIFEYTVDYDDLVVLIIELEELKIELNDGDIITIQDQMFNEESIEDMIEECITILGELDDGDIYEFDSDDLVVSLIA